MEAQTIYNEIFEITKKMDRLFEEHRKLEAKFSKSESIDTHLLGNMSSSVKKVVDGIRELENREDQLSQRLKNMGYGINGRDYTLVQYDENKMHIKSAMYGFLVQY